MSATMEGNLSTFMNYFESTTVGYIDSKYYNNNNCTELYYCFTCH